MLNRFIDSLCRISSLKYSLRTSTDNIQLSVNMDCKVCREEFRGELLGGAFLDTDAKCRICGKLAGQHAASVPGKLYLLQNLLCIESYVVMSPFYYSNYQSILFCVECVIKFLSHNDVCVCLSIVLYALVLHFSYYML